MEMGESLRYSLDPPEKVYSNDSRRKCLDELGIIAREGGKLMPQWYIKILLVCVVTGNIFKFRGKHNIFSPKSS
ncbi:hypothetical protein EBU71_23270 [bacterium]|jgi:hypothetical protein|nr:hypothetical protein [Candidatus Elulimicrobium humile]